MKRVLGAAERVKNRLPWTVDEVAVSDALGRDLRPTGFETVYGNMVGLDLYCVSMSSRDEGRDARL